MSEENEGVEQSVGIYVLPTEEGMPPRAMLMQVAGVIEIPEELQGDDTTPEQLQEYVQQWAQAHQALATWSRDLGTWTIDGMPVEPGLADAITEHAKNLGVEW